MKKYSAFGMILTAALVIADIALWRSIIGIILIPKPLAQTDFIGAGATNAELVIFDSGEKVLIDAGPDGSVESKLESILGPDNRAIDIAIISSPDRARFAGFTNIISRYRIGALIYNGRNPGAFSVSDAVAWSVLVDAVRSRGIPLITLGAQDKINLKNGTLTIQSPDEAFARSGDRDETRFILHISAPEFGFTIDSSVKTQPFAKKGEILRLSKVGGTMKLERLGDIMGT